MCVSESFWISTDNFCMHFASSGTDLSQWKSIWHKISAVEADNRKRLFVLYKPNANVDNVGKKIYAFMQPILKQLLYVWTYILLILRIEKDITPKKKNKEAAAILSDYQGNTQFMSDLPVSPFACRFGWSRNLNCHSYQGTNF